MTATELGRVGTTVPVLMYHSISKTCTQAFRPFTVSPALFASHVDLLVRAGYTTLTISDLADLRRSRRPPPARAVAITVDDAFADFSVNALPVLAGAGLRATLYVPTGYVGATSRWLIAEGEQARRLLNWAELVSIDEQGVECGAHTHSHPQLDLVGRRFAAREVALSKALLEDQLQHEIRTFAYPFGYSNAGVREMVEALGFTSACRVGDLISSEADDVFAIPRLTVTPDITPAALHQLLASPRTSRGETLSRLRELASRGLRTARLKKRANAPGQLPFPPTAP
ncbi:MAG: polysaccharide deacetylase family protein [Nocardioidaceae bacterium]